MANSSKEVTLTSAQQNAFTTPTYLEQSHIKVYVNNVLVDGTAKVFGTLSITNPSSGAAEALTYAFTNSGAASINFSHSLPTGTVVRIDRNSSQDLRLVDYSDASLLTADTLDADSNQMFFVAQEALDQASKTNLAAGSFYYSQGTEPSNVPLGTVWFDTSATPNTLKVYASEGWRFVAPVHETTKYTLASGIGSDSTTYNNALNFVTHSNFTKSSYLYKNGVKQLRATAVNPTTDNVLEVIAGTAQYALASGKLWFSPVSSNDVILVEAYYGSFSQEVTNKEASAQVAKTAAETAQAAAETAKTAAETAKTAAETAETNAAGHSSTASGHKDTATTQAGIATTKASEAATSASTATTKASEAATSASTATTKASEAATSASNAATSASNAASTLANAVTLDTSQTITGAKSFTGGISLPDSDIAGFGTSEDRGTSYNGNALGNHFDLEIYHDGSNSYVRDFGSGNLAIQGTDVSIRDNSGNRRIFTADGSTGSVALYYGDSSSGSKLDTTSLGVNVTGTVTANGLNVSGNTSGSNTNPVEVLSLPTNSKIEFDNTFSIQHRTYSDPYAYIREAGSGGLRLEGANVSVFTNDGSSDGASFDVQRINAIAGASGGVKLYYGDETNFANHKFETTSTGIDVTGEVKGDSLDIDGAVDIDTGGGTFDLDLGASTATITTSGNGNCLVLKSTAATGSNDAPTLLLYRQASSTANNNHTGSVRFRANNSTGSEVIDYGRILSMITEDNDGSEEGKMIFEVFDHASGASANLKDILTLESLTTTVGNNLDVNGTVTADALDIDGTVDIDTGNTVFDVNTGSDNAVFTSSNQGRQFQVVCTSTLDTACPDLVLRKANDTTGDDEFNSGNIRFENAHNDGYNLHAYATITSYIVDQGASETDRTEADAQIRFAVMDGNDSSTALKDPVEKLKIYKDGIDVTGTVTADGFKVGSGNNELTITTQNNDTFFKQTTATGNVFLDANNFVVRDQSDQSYRINCGDSDGVVLYGSGSANRIETGFHTEGVLFKTGASGGLSTRAEITNSGLTVNGTVTTDQIHVDAQVLDTNDASSEVTATEMAGYVGQTITFTASTGTTARTVTLPDAVTADVGKRWVLCNAATANITVALNSQKLNILSGSSVVNCSNNPHIVAGGVAEIICVAGGTGTDAQPNYIVFGSGVVNN